MTENERLDLWKGWIFATATLDSGEGWCATKSMIAHGERLLSRVFLRGCVICCFPFGQFILSVSHIGLRGGSYARKIHRYFWFFCQFRNVIGKSRRYPIPPQISPLIGPFNLWLFKTRKSDTIMEVNRSPTIIHSFGKGNESTISEFPCKMHSASCSNCVSCFEFYRKFNQIASVCLQSKVEVISDNVPSFIKWMPFWKQRLGNHLKPFSGALVSLGRRSCVCT